MPGMNKIRKNLRRHPVKDWKKGALLKDWDCTNWGCPANGARYEPVNFCTWQDLKNSLAKVDRIQYDAAAYAKVEQDVTDIADSFFAELKVKWGTASYKKFTLRNNDLHSVHVRIYEYVASDHHSTNITTAYLNAVDRHLKLSSTPADLAALEATQYLWEYPTAAEHEMDQKWIRKKKVKHVYMPPGSMFTYTLKPGSYKELDYAELEGKGVAYIAGVSKEVLFRFNGTLAHGTTITNVGFSAVDSIDISCMEVKQALFYELSNRYIESMDDRVDATGWTYGTGTLQTHSNKELEST